MRERAIIGVGIILILSIFADTCVSKSIPPPAKPTQTLATSVLTLAEEQPWQKEWTRLVKEAQKERKVLIYGSTGGGALRSALIQSFKDKYDIQLEYVAGRGPEMVTKINAERNAGLFLVDILMAAGAPGAANLKPAGAFDPLEPALILPEVKDPKNWYDSKLPWMDQKERTTIAFLINPYYPFAVNTTLVKPGEIKSLRDLLNPKWRGKILISDPINPGPFTNWVGLMANNLMDIGYLYKIAEQQPAVVENVRLQAEWLSHGKYAVLIGPNDTALEEFRRVGAPIESIIPIEGTQLTAGAGVIRLINKAPHPNAARLFVNWLLSKEGQTTYSKATGEQSAREDVPVNHIDPQGRRQPGVKYIVNISEEWLFASKDREKLSKEIFGHLVK